MSNAQMENRQPLLEIRGLTKEFRQGKDRVKAVRQMDLDIYKGEVFGLVGESGCGKSTFGQMLVHLLDPTSGTITLAGEDITRPARRERKDLCKRMQIVFQDPYSSIDPNKTIGWLVEEPLRIHGIGKTQKERDEKVGKVLKAVGLDDSYRTRWPNELSGGQKAKLLFLKMSLDGCNVLILDEPTRNFSPLSGPVIRQVLKEYPGAIISISHDRKYLEEVVDTTYELTEQGLVKRN